MIIEFLNVWGGHQATVLGEYLREEARRVDVFCFQEADKLFPEIAERVLGDRFASREAHKYVSRDDVFAQMVMVRHGIKIEECQTVLENYHGVGLGIRCAVRQNGTGIEVVNFHGISRPGNKKDTPLRLEQSEELLGLRGRRRLIIGGDFNLDIVTESVEMIRRSGLRNLISENGVRTTRNRLAWEKFPNNPQLHSDFVFVGPEVKVRKFSVVENEVSDHLPLVLEVE